MNNMKDVSIELMLKAFNAKYEVEELDVGEFKKIKAGPIKFKISQYNIKGVGNLSVMRGSAMLGLMKMDTLILCSFEKDAPIFSYDRIHAMGNDTMIFELYDSYINGCDVSPLDDTKVSGGLLPDYKVSERWYDAIKLPCSVSKKTKSKYSQNVNEFVMDYFNEFLKVLDGAEPCDTAVKKPLVDKYTQGLLDNGGASTDVFVKYIGKEKTEELFNKVLFASK